MSTINIKKKKKSYSSGLNHIYSTQIIFIFSWGQEGDRKSVLYMFLCRIIYQFVQKIF